MPDNESLHDAPALAFGETLMVPAPDGVDRAISEVMARHQAELDAALEPFGVALGDLVQATWMRFVHIGDVQAVWAGRVRVIDSYVDEDADSQVPEEPRRFGGAPISDDDPDNAPWRRYGRGELTYDEAVQLVGPLASPVPEIDAEATVLAAERPPLPLTRGCCGPGGACSSKACTGTPREERALLPDASDLPTSEPGITLWVNGQRRRLPLDEKTGRVVLGGLERLGVTVSQEEAAAELAGMGIRYEVSGGTLPDGPSAEALEAEARDHRARIEGEAGRVTSADVFPEPRQDTAVFGTVPLQGPLEHAKVDLLGALQSSLDRARAFQAEADANGYGREADRG